MQEQSFLLQEMIRFHDLLKQHNLTLVTSAVVPDDDANVSYMMARLKVSSGFVTVLAPIFSSKAK